MHVKIHIFQTMNVNILLPGHVRNQVTINMFSKECYCETQKTVDTRNYYWNVHCSSTNQTRNETTGRNHIKLKWSSDWFSFATQQTLILEIFREFTVFRVLN